MSEKNIYRLEEVVRKFVEKQHLFPADISDYSWDKIEPGVYLVLWDERLKHFSIELIICADFTEHPNTSFGSINILTLNKKKIRISYNTEAQKISSEYIFKDINSSIYLFPDYVGYNDRLEYLTYYVNGRCDWRFGDYDSFSRAAITVCEDNITFSTNSEIKDIEKIIRVKIGQSISIPIKFGSDFISGKLMDIFRIKYFDTNFESMKDEICNRYVLITGWGDPLSQWSNLFLYQLVKDTYYYEKYRQDERGLFLQPNMDVLEHKFVLIKDIKVLGYISPNCKELSVYPKIGYVKMETNTNQLYEKIINFTLAIHDIPIYPDKIPYSNKALRCLCFAYVTFSEKNHTVSGVFDGEFYQNYFCDYLLYKYSNNYNEFEEVVELFEEIDGKYGDYNMLDTLKGWHYGPYQIRQGYDSKIDNGELGKMLDELNEMVEKLFEEKIKPLIRYKW